MKNIMNLLAAGLIFIGIMLIAPIALLIISPTKGIPAILAILAIPVLTHNQPQTELIVIGGTWFATFALTTVVINYRIDNFKPMLGLSSIELLRTIAPKTKKRDNTRGRQTKQTTDIKNQRFHNSGRNHENGL